MIAQTQRTDIQRRNFDSLNPSLLPCVANHFTLVMHVKRRAGEDGVDSTASALAPKPAGGVPMPMANVHQNANDNVPSVRLDRVSVSAFLRASEAAKIERRPGETMHDALARSNADKLERVEALLIAGVKPTAAARWVGVPEWVAHRINRKLILALAAVVCLGGCAGSEPDHVWDTYVAR